MKNSIGLVFLVLALLTVLSGCSASSNRCNETILKEFYQVKLSDVMTLKEFSEAMFMDAKEGTLKWSISPRSDYGCLVELKGDLNGISTLGMSYFIDLDTRRVTGDNEMAKSIITGVAQGTGDYSIITDGLPLP